MAYSYTWFIRHQHNSFLMLTTCSLCFENVGRWSDFVTGPSNAKNSRYAEKFQALGVSVSQKLQCNTEARLVLWRLQVHCAVQRAPQVEIGRRELGRSWRPQKPVHLALSLTLGSENPKAVLWRRGKTKQFLSRRLSRCQRFVLQ